MKETLIPLKYNKDDYLALWKITSAESDKNKHVLLTHGTFSNRKVLKGITTFLVEHHYTCWVFEWRNHGESSHSNNKFNFETIGQEDFKIVFDYLFEDGQIEKIDCVTHSGGGICLTIALINYPDYKQCINRITLFGCQAFGAAQNSLNYARVLIGKYLSKTIGFIPARIIGGAENEPYYMMKQWFDWNLNQNFLGSSRIDYQEKMKEIKIPVLSIFGAGDQLIAPPIGCQLFLSAFENPLNESLYCGEANGFAENYNHSRIIHSQNARKEIYPRVLEWMTTKLNSQIPKC